MADIDPATFEIVKNALYKIAEEMQVVLAKTAYSPILKSAGDYSCGVFDAEGEMVAQGPDLPIHLGSMPRRRARRGRAPSAPTCTTATSSSTTTPTSAAAICPTSTWSRPAFHEGRLLGYACLRAHWPDVGSATPGSYGAVTEIYGEGLRLPPLRLVAAGVAQPRPREDHPRQRAHARRAQGRPAAPSSPPTCARTERLAELAEKLRRRTGSLADMAGGHGLLRAADARDARRPARRGRRFEDFCDGDGIPEDARRQGRAVLDPHAREEGGRPAHRRLRRHRPPGVRAR